MIETKESDWIGFWKFKYIWCKKPIWINFIPWFVKVIDDTQIYNEYKDEDAK